MDDPNTLDRVLALMTQASASLAAAETFEVHMPSFSFPGPPNLALSIQLPHLYHSRLLYSQQQ